MSRHILAALLTAVVLAPAQTEAQPPKRWAAWQFQWENDAFALFSGSDEHYTNGIRFSWIRNPEHRAVPGWIEDAGKGWCRKTKLCGIGAGDPTVHLGHSVSQTFYTPEDITVPQLIVTDRPYAAYLHFGTQVFLRNDDNLWKRRWERW